MSISEIEKDRSSRTRDEKEVKRPVDVKDLDENKATMSRIDGDVELNAIPH